MPKRSPGNKPPRKNAVKGAVHDVLLGYRFDHQPLASAVLRDRIAGHCADAVLALLGTKEMKT